MATIARFEDSDAWQTTWTVEIDVLPGCISWAPTRGEAVDMAQEAIEAWVLTAIRCGDDIPEIDRCVLHYVAEEVSSVS